MSQKLTSKRIEILNKDEFREEVLYKNTHGQIIFTKEELKEEIKKAGIHQDALRQYRENIKKNRKKYKKNNGK